MHFVAGCGWHHSRASPVTRSKHDRQCSGAWRGARTRIIGKACWTSRSGRLDAENGVNRGMNGWTRQRMCPPFHHGQLVPGRGDRRLILILHSETICLGFLIKVQLLAYFLVWLIVYCPVVGSLSFEFFVFTAMAPHSNSHQMTDDRWPCVV